MGTQEFTIKHLPYLLEQLPYTVPCAADARISMTKYADDSVWKAQLGTGDAPALAMQTHFGGRANLVSLVPMWTLNGQVRYEASAYHDAPRLLTFASNYQVIEARPFLPLAWLGEHIALDSHTLGGVYKVTNHGDHPITFTMELYGHVIVGGEELRLKPYPKDGAFGLGQIGNLQPVVMLEKGATNPESSARIGITLTLLAGDTRVVRWVCVAQDYEPNSLAYARAWLKTSWKPFFAASTQAASALPHIISGHGELDRLFYLSGVRLVQAFVAANGRLPAPVMVQTRHIHTGFSPKGDGSDYPRAWKGVDVFTAARLAPVLATIAPDLAQGLVLNFLATQREDGFVDLRPAPSGQMSEILCTPLLCAMAWRVYDITRDDDFLARVFPKLQAFLSLWLQPLQAKQPLTWHDQRQTGYPYFPMFSTQAWGQGVDVRTVIAPDLLAYLVSECVALKQMAQARKDERAAKAWAKQENALRKQLVVHQQGSIYAYRDIELGALSPAQTLLKDAAVDQPQFVQAQMSAPSRLLVRVVGGVSHVPTFTLTLNGVGRDGKPFEEVFTQKDFTWNNRQGFLTTRAVYQQLDRVSCNGLSRVYRVTVTTPDLTYQDINAVMPLALQGAQGGAMLVQALEQLGLWGANGITMLGAEPEALEPSEAWGAGGVWLYWQEHLGACLPAKQLLALLERLLAVQARVLTQTGKFAQAYHGSLLQGIGEADFLSGIFPLGLFLHAIGVQIVNAGEVRLSPYFAWGKTIAIEQHGVVVRRTRAQIVVKFPSGYREVIKQLNEPRVLVDPKSRGYVPPERIASPIIKPLYPPPAQGANRVMIPIEHED